ncbi:Vacuolar-processing enzyme [Dendrobium catenatum]|uniref:Vacuolar-processing enzyme n=1 Tax=Dendrobium catenatum TaxID=906689 RepID=A0A2I0W0C6_9ASPA|nr:Vacuolar-processing enzyme [Dendrobium catenatum]
MAARRWSGDGRAEVQWRSETGRWFGDGRRPGSGSTKVGQKSSDGRTSVRRWSAAGRWFDEGSSKKLDAQKELLDILTHRVHVDNSINLIGKLLFGLEKGIQVLSAVPKTGHPFVDDLACLESIIRIFETHCGSLSKYGMKHIHSLANICNAGISNETVAKVSAEVCSQFPSTRPSSLHRGFSA